MASKTHSFTDRQRMSRSTFEVYHYRDENVKEVALHHHDFYEIYFFIAGKVTYNIESRNFTLSPGDILLISPMELHQPIFPQEHSGYDRYVLWINKNFLDRLNLPGQELSRCFDTQRPEHINLLRPDGTKREYLNYLLRMLQHRQPRIRSGL
jgi:hypothetical protein